MHTPVTLWDIKRLSVSHSFITSITFRNVVINVLCAKPLQYLSGLNQECCHEHVIVHSIQLLYCIKTPVRNSNYLNKSARHNATYHRLKNHGCITTSVHIKNAKQGMFMLIKFPSPFCEPTVTTRKLKGTAPVTSQPTSKHREATQCRVRIRSCSLDSVHI